MGFLVSGLGIGFRWWRVVWGLGSAVQGLCWDLWLKIQVSGFRFRVGLWVVGLLYGVSPS